VSSNVALKGVSAIDVVIHPSCCRVQSGLTIATALIQNTLLRPTVALYQFNSALASDSRVFYGHVSECCICRQITQAAKS
jgi:hypothetical protein